MPNDTDELKYTVRAANQHAQMWKWMRRFSVSGGWATFNNSPAGPTLNIPKPPPQRPTRPHQFDTLLVRVVENNVATAPVVQLVKCVGETGDLVGDPFPVVSLCKMASGDEFYVFQPTVLKDQPEYQIGSTRTVKIHWRDVRQPGIYDFDLTASGGSAGANPADRTYTIKLHGYTTTISASAQSPLIRFSAGRLSDATRGQGSIDEDGVPTLHIAYEALYGAGDCGA